MKSEKPLYLTTTLPYVNADPHIGFAYEILVGDVLSRTARTSGRAVFFNTGTDEHGQKIANKADEKGESRQAYVDHYASEFKKLGVGLDLSFDNFIRTTDEVHKQAAQAIWQKCMDAGDIYKKSYTGLYCVGCEAFKKESDLVDGKCPDHNVVPESVTEENYFFKLSNYQSYLEEYLGQEGVIEPEWRRQEALNFVKQGLEDFSISREKSRLDWGIPVPNDEEQVMYVWFDALTNYISTLGWPEMEGNFKKFWMEGEVIQLAGKDQVRFQSIMWQAMLRSAGLKATDKVVYHGFINSGGQKMSKSLGNVISPYDLITRYGTDATRYLLLRHVHPFDDSDVTLEKLDEWYTANLVNGLGNLVARVMKMAEDNLGGPVAVEAKPVEETFQAKIANYRIDEAIDLIFEHISKGDSYIQETQPFKMLKAEDESVRAEGKVIVERLIGHLYRISEHLVPLLPKTATLIQEAIKANKKPENLFKRLE